MTEFVIRIFAAYNHIRWVVQNGLNTGEVSCELQPTGKWAQIARVKNNLNHRKSLLPFGGFFVFTCSKGYSGRLAQTLYG